MNSTLLRTFLPLFPLLALGATPLPGQQTARASGPAVAMQVYKTPTCGCCAKWVEHAKLAGFVPEIHDMPDVSPVKAKVGLPPALQSCHTALVGGYVIEGHVPADLIQRLLEEKPKVAGLAVPGMPVGSPGMEMGDRRDPYDVIAFTKDGTTSVYAKR
jgi:hypothetical protein